MSMITHCSTETILYFLCELLFEKILSSTNETNWRSYILVDERLLWLYDLETHLCETDTSWSWDTTNTERQEKWHCPPPHLIRITKPRDTRTEKLKRRWELDIAPLVKKLKWFLWENDQSQIFHNCMMIMALRAIIALDFSIEIIVVLVFEEKLFWYFFLVRGVSFSTTAILDDTTALL